MSFRFYNLTADEDSENQIKFSITTGCTISSINFRVYAAVLKGVREFQAAFAL